MKSVFSICKIFVLCFLIIYTFSSCSSYLVVNGNQQVPKKVTIHVTGYNITSGELTMVDDSGHDAVTLKAWPGQKIRWKLSDPRHHAIIKIDVKPTNKNDVFADGPHTVWLSKSWKGALKDKAAIQLIAVKDANGDVYYEYKILWEENGTQHTHDPRIQIRFDL